MALSIPDGRQAFDINGRQIQTGNIHIEFGGGTGIAFHCGVRVAVGVYQWIGGQVGCIGVISACEHKDPIRVPACVGQGVLRVGRPEIAV